jgi:hypothetical protein
VRAKHPPHAITLFSHEVTLCNSLRHYESKLELRKVVKYTHSHVTGCVCKVTGPTGKLAAMSDAAARRLDAVGRHLAMATPKSPDQDGLLEYSVVYSDRSLNHMSARFQVGWSCMLVCNCREFAF